WGPIPWMIEVAAVLSAVVRHWTDLIVICALLLFNAIIGFWQERKAQNALEALKSQLALRARVRRDGKWQEVAAQDLVPGDVVRVRIGDIIPADIKLTDGDFLSVDQSALTGESLPVDKQSGDIAYSGSTAKQGDMVGLVTATGAHTAFGKTAALVAKAGGVSHFQKAVLHIGDYLIFVSLGLVAILIIVELFRGESPLDLIQFALILTVASIPVAMPAVLSVTMAVGALALAKMQAIVSRLASIEELAGIDVLCSDKTGTLTQNKLKLGDPAPAAGTEAGMVVLMAALTCDPDAGDAIDRAVVDGLDNKYVVAQYKQLHFKPFDPVRKHADADVQGPDGKRFAVAKGAPQVVMDLAKLGGSAREEAEKKVNEFAGHGFRTLGVARRAGESEDGAWEFLGLLPLFDPPREDSKETIEHAEAHGIHVKMVTGDDLAIGKEIAGQLGLGANLVVADEHFGQDTATEEFADRVERADGFAQVFPEHKYRIVKALQSRGHLVGMTGDGVNDAPALKQADAGIAVSGATDAARAAASLVLMAPGLSVIVNAVEHARMIFERMNSYAIYRIVETIRIMFFVVAAMIAFNFYPITAIMIILLAFFNDVPIMTISIDKTWLDPKPVRWNMRRVLTVATVLGLVGVVETFGLLVIAREGLHLDIAQIQSLIFLKLVVAGHMTLFVVRSRRHFFRRPWPSPWLIGALFSGEILATLLVTHPFGLIAAISWRDAGIVWAYALAWIPIEDWAKMAVYRHIDFSRPSHMRFLRTAQQTLHGQT
ncbi:MAG: plasma-membrane proton-efflux P-type ATPase, partial [Gammaproteobacteria bacterium]